MSLGGDEIKTASTPEPFRGCGEGFVMTTIVADVEVTRWVWLIARTLILRVKFEEDGFS